MALGQRNTTRFRARVGNWIRAAVWSTAQVLESLLNFQKEDQLRERGIKTADFAIRRTLYFGLDYGLTVFQVAIGVGMRALGFSLLEIFSVLWVFDFIAAGFFVLIYEVTGKDLSLGEDFRRAVETIKGKSRFAGIMATAGVIFLAFVWTGPEKIITFFRKEIRTKSELILILAILTSIQAFVWAWIYSSGYDQLAKFL